MAVPTFAPPSELAETPACPNCASRAMEKRRDLVHEGHKGGMAIANLHGYVCEKCGSRWFTPASAQIIRSLTEQKRPANYEVKISRIGGKSLGLYLPKDMVRVLNLKAGTVGFVTPTGANSFIVELQPDEENSRADLDDDVLVY